MNENAITIIKLNNLKYEVGDPKQEKEGSSREIRTMDWFKSFFTDTREFTKESDIIKLTQKLNKKLRTLMTKESKSPMIEKVITSLSLCDILFEELQNVGFSKPSYVANQSNPSGEGIINDANKDQLPNEYDFRALQPLLIVSESFSEHQKYCLENFYINMKRSLLGLLQYVSVWY